MTACLTVFVASRSPTYALSAGRAAGREKLWGVTRLPVPVTYNFRPVAGTRPGALYRSDALAQLTREGRLTLRELGVTRVIDLRSTLDRRLGGPDRLWPSGAELVRVPMLSGAKKSDVYGLTLETLYRRLLDHHRAAIGAAIRAVADAPTGAVVVHCTAGKDRSGVTAALIQLSAGVDVDTVLLDYTLTQANLAGPWAERMLRRVARFGIDITPQLERVLLSSPAEALVAALEHLETEHGGLDSYLAACGITDTHRERLHERLAE